MGRSRPIRSQRMNPERERQELVPQNKKNWFFDSFFFNIKQKYGYVNKIYKRTELRLPATLYRLSLQRSQRFSQWEVAMVLPWHLGKQMTRWVGRLPIQNSISCRFSRGVEPSPGYILEYLRIGLVALLNSPNDSRWPRLYILKKRFHSLTFFHRWGFILNEDYFV
jgi:hypothetical protein